MGGLEVLILVLMDDALVPLFFLSVGYLYGVLILVLMDDALVHKSFFGFIAITTKVLILVLMDDALVRV